MLTYHVSRTSGGWDRAREYADDLRWAIRDHAGELLAQAGHSVHAETVRWAPADGLVAALKLAHREAREDGDQELSRALDTAWSDALDADQANDPALSSAGDVDQLVPRLIASGLEQRQALRRLRGLVATPA